MQFSSQDTYRERSIYYLCRSVNIQGVKGKRWRYKIHPVYGIYIMNFHLGWEGGDKPLSEVLLKNKETGEVFSDKLRMFFLDLKAFQKKSEDECENDLERWIYSIKNMPTMTETPKMATRKQFTRLYTEAELSALSKKERAVYERDLRNYRDRLMDAETRRNEKKRARAEGFAEGQEVTQKEERARALLKDINIAKQLIINKGWNPSEAAAFVGVPLELLLSN